MPADACDTSLLNRLVSWTPPSSFWRPITVQLSRPAWAIGGWQYTKAVKKDDHGKTIPWNAHRLPESLRAPADEKDGKAVSSSGGGRGSGQNSGGVAGGAARKRNRNQGKSAIAARGPRQIASAPTTPLPAASSHRQLPIIELDDKKLLFNDPRMPLRFSVSGHPDYHGVQCGNVGCETNWLFCELSARLCPNCGQQFQEN